MNNIQKRIAEEYKAKEKAFYRFNKDKKRRERNRKILGCMVFIIVPALFYGLLMLVIS